ncbi:MAG: hypothetical protein U0361_13935 [Nitrospiraceae bacterium]
MEHAVAAVQGTSSLKAADQGNEDFRKGVIAVLDYLEGFWVGLDRRRSPDFTPHEVHPHAA